MKRGLILAAVSVLVLFTGCDRFKRTNYEEIAGKVREILQIPTFEHVYRDIIYLDKDPRIIKTPGRKERLLFSIDVIVQAGIDFTEGLIISPGDDDRSINITLPHAKILLIDAKEDSINQFFFKSQRGDLTLLDYYSEIEKGKERILKDALDRDILFRAEENAKKLLLKFLELAGFETVRFFFAENGVKA